MDAATKAKLTDLYNHSSTKDKLVKEIDQLKKELVPLIKKNGLTQKKFDFGDKFLRYKTFTDHGSISQKLLRDVLDTYYPSVNKQEFMQRVLSMRNSKTKETIDVINKK